MSSWKPSSSASPAGGTFPHDIKTRSELTHLYNQRVTTAELVQRPLGSTNMSIGPVKHSGVRVTLEDKRQFLIHKGLNYGKASETVVVDAKHMSNKWKVVSVIPIEGKIVADFVKAGGEDYHIIFDNCHDAAKNMMT